MRRLWAAVDATDLLGLMGVGAVEYGVSCWSVPAAWVLGGVLLMAVAIRANIRGGSS